MIKIKEIKQLLKDCKVTVWKRQLESDLKCWMAIKDLIDRNEK